MRRSAGLVIAVMLASPEVWAQQPLPRPDAPNASVAPNLSLSGRYGVVLRSGRQQVAGAGFDYGGFTASDFALRATWFPTTYFGLQLGGGREAFAVLADGESRGRGSLLRAELAGVVRFGGARWRTDAFVGYAWNQLPQLGTVSAPGFAAGMRHAAVLGARGAFWLTPKMWSEAGAELPLTLSANDAEGRPAQSAGFAASAGIGMVLGKVGLLGYGAALQYQLTSDRLVGADALFSSQRVSRIGVRLDVWWMRAPPPPVRGSVLIRVSDHKARPLGGARVRVEVPGAVREVITGEDGQAQIPGVLAGSVRAQLLTEDYVPVERGGELAAGGELELSFKASPVPKAQPQQQRRRGDLTIRIRDAKSGAPVVAAQVRVGKDLYFTDGTGAVSLVDLAAGEIPVTVTLPGYATTERTPEVVPGSNTILSVDLEPAPQ